MQLHVERKEEGIQMIENFVFAFENEGGRN